MQQINLNRQKLIALVIAALVLIFMILNWRTPTKLIEEVLQLGRAMGRIDTEVSLSENGFHGWGFLSLAGIAGVVLASLMGDKQRPFEGQTKQIALASFAVIILGAAIYLINLLTGSIANKEGELRKLSETVNPAIGLYLCMAAGIAGIIWVGQFIKTNLMMAPANQSQPPPPLSPPPPPPPK